MLRIKIVFIIFSFFIFFGKMFAQPAVDGHWEGAITVFSNDIGIKVNFKTDPDSIRGTIDIPQQSAKNLNLIHIQLALNKFSFELPVKPAGALFNGVIKDDSITGKFLQGGFTGTFYLLRGELKHDQSADSTQAPLPYKEEEVTFTNGENSFAGTLTLPETAGKHPAVVMITGSGPQNRDEEIMGFKPFRIIADNLTRNGIAVLRYDDRSVGGSKGKSVVESTTEEFAGDVIEAVKYLKTRDDINPDQIGLCGHSEGGVIAPMVASKYNVGFIVLIAGTGVMGIDILKEQSKLIMKADSSTDAEVNGYMKMLDMVYDAVKNNTGWDEIKKKFRESMERSYKKLLREQKEAYGSKEKYVNTMTDVAMSEFTSPWMEYFMAYDPYPALTKVTCPVLALFGGKDMQVPVKQNEKPMRDALTKAGNKDFTIKTFPDANHLFQNAITGNPAEYATLPKEFLPGFLDTITGWIAARVTIVKQ